MDRQEGVGRRVALEMTRGAEQARRRGYTPWSTESRCGTPTGTLVGCFSCYRVSERRTGVLLTANKRYIEI